MMEMKICIILKIKDLLTLSWV